MKLKKLLEIAYNDEDITVSNQGIRRLPNNLPEYVPGNFFCESNYLKTLEGCPSEIGGVFSCESNMLTSLEHGPKSVGHNYICGDNNLTTLKGAPSKIKGDFVCSENKLGTLHYGPVQVQGRLNCSYNGLETLEDCPYKVGRDFICVGNRLGTLKDIHKHIKSIGGDFDCSDNPLKSHVLGLVLIKIGGKIRTGINDEIDKILNRNKNAINVFQAQEELIEAGFEEFAQL